MPSSSSAHVYIASVLLDLNRWTKEKQPTYLVSEWLSRFEEARFDGVELWEYHAIHADDKEVDALAEARLPMAIYNTYAKLDDASKADRDRAAEYAERVGARGMKFNFGNDPALRDESVRNVQAWLENMPAHFRLLCECHPNTIAEEPEAARDLFDAVGDPRLQAIVHIRMPDKDAKTTPAHDMKRWCDILQGRITHTHVQTRPELDPQAIAEQIEVLRLAGFSGTHTLEFTVGTRTEGESIDMLWENALKDLRAMRESLA